MAMLNETVSPQHDLASIVNDLIDRGQEREALALMLFSDTFGKATNGHAQMEPEKLDALFTNAALTAQDIRRAVETHIPSFFAVVAPPEKTKPVEIKPGAEPETNVTAFPKPAPDIILPTFTSAAREAVDVVENPFADKAISKLFPNLGIVLAQAGFRKGPQIIEALISLGIKKSSATSALSLYFNLVETRDQARYPFQTMTGERLKQIILEKLGQEAVDLAELKVGQSPKTLTPPEVEQEIEQPVETVTELTPTPQTTDAPLEPDAQTTLEENPFIDKAISKKFPNLGIVLGRMGLRRPGDIAKKLHALGLTQGSSIVAAAQYLGLRERGTGDSPFTSSTGRRLKQIILDALGADAVAFAEQRTPTLAADIPVETSFAQAALTATNAPEKLPVPADTSPPTTQAPEVAQLPLKAAPPLSPVPTPTSQPKQERTYSSANNFFAAFYLIKRVAPEDVQTDIQLTILLREAGIVSYNDLLQRRQQRQLTLNLTNNTIEKLQKRAKALGINSELRAGEFRAGKTTVPSPAPPKPPISAAIQRAHAEFAGQQRERIPVYEEKPKAVQPFSTLVLSELTPHEQTLLMTFMRKLKQMPMVRNAVNRRAMDGKISIAVLGDMSLYSMLFTASRQPAKVAQALVTQLVTMGAITDERSRGLRVSPAFLSRFTELYDWSLINDKSAGDLYGRVVSPATLAKPGPH